MVRRRADARLDPPRAVDGLGQRLLHVLGHEHRVHLALSPPHARPRLALPGPPLDRVVPALRHVHLPARADRALLRQDRPVALRSLSAARSRRRVARRLDDDAVDAAGERRGGGQPGRRVRSARERRVGGGRAGSGRRVRRASSRARRSSGLAYEGPFDNLPAAGGVEHRVIPWAEVSLEEGTGIVHIAPGCGSEDFELSRVHELAGADARSTRPGASTPTTAGCTAREPPRRPGRSSPTCRSAGA